MRGRHYLDRRPILNDERNREAAGQVFDMVLRDKPCRMVNKADTIDLQYSAGQSQPEFGAP